MPGRPKGPHINPTREEMIEREPLLVFSFYLSGRVNVLLGIADEIVEHLNQGMSDEVIDGDRVGRASTLMWLWTLGAYEVVRTLCQASSCFSPSAQVKFQRLKKRLSVARIPAAKMEVPGKKIPVASNRSSDGWDFRNKDLFVGDPESPSDISVRLLIKEFSNVFATLSKDDVFSQHEDAYTP